MLNNDYVTPDNVRAAAAPFVDDARYFTDGDDRPPFYGAWQPRLGFSYDITGKGRTVAFGGWGRYYDRVLYNSTLDERFRLQYAVRTFQFSQSGGIRDGVADDRLGPVLPERGRARGDHRAGARAESRGVPDRQRRRAAACRTSGRSAPATASPAWSPRSPTAGMRSRNLFTFIFGTRRPDGTLLPDGAGIREHPDVGPGRTQGVVRRPLRPGRSSVRRRAGEVRLQPHLHAGQVGTDRRRSVQPGLPASRPTIRVIPTGTDERHRLVMTRHRRACRTASSRARSSRSGSGTPYTIDDQSQGGGVNERRLLRNGGRPEQFTFIIPDAWAYRSVDLQLEKAFRFGGRAVGVGDLPGRSTSSASTTSPAIRDSSRRCRPPTRTSAARAA